MKREDALILLLLALLLWKGKGYATVELGPSEPIPPGGPIVDPLWTWDTMPEGDGF